MTGWLRSHGPGGAVVVAAGLASLVALYFWDDWFLNWDGGFYLWLARRIVDGEAYRFPDGTFPSFRGPIYPMVLGTPWVAGLETSVRSAIWASRVVIAANAALVAGLAQRLGARPLPALAGGLVAALSPLPLVAGGLFFVPDAAAAFFVLLALLLATGRPTRTNALIAGGALGLAFLTKEVAALGLFAAVALVASDEERTTSGRFAALVAGWLIPVGAWLLFVWSEVGTLAAPFDQASLAVIAAAIVASAVAVAALEYRGSSMPWWAHPTLGVVAGLAVLVLIVPPVEAWSDLWVVLGRDLRQWLFGDLPLWIVVVGAALVGFGSARAPRGRAVALTMIGIGLGILAHSSLSALGPRSAVVLTYGLALAAALGLANPGFGRLAAAIGTAALVVTGVLGGAHANDRLDAAAQTWAAPAVRSASAFLQSAEGSVVSTPVFGSYLAFLDPDKPIELLPVLSRDRRSASDVALTFSDQVHWAGTIATDAETPDVVAATVGRRVTSGFTFQGVEAGDLLVVTGNTAASASPFDGAGLLPLLEADPAATRVFQSTLSQLPQWVVVYRVTGGLTTPDLLPVTMAVEAPLPGGPREVAPVALIEQRDGVLDVLRSPLTGEG